jgi:hypothetical protein
MSVFDNKYPQKIMVIMTPETHKLLQEKFPFLTILTYLNTEYIGIIQNSDSQFVSLYILEPTLPNAVKREFLLCGETWWWESNRTIPINLFLREKFKPFKQYLKTFAKKEVNIVEGPSINVMDLINKKLKRRTIQLVKIP